jgi:CheY-like chemotaxis protein
MRLLLVEDHEATMRVLTNLLTRDGHTVTGASTITQALDAARCQTFDAVVSDLGLPDGTGIELMEQLRDNHQLTGIALSGYGMESDLRRSKEAGFAAHLVKPVNFEELRRALRALRSEA